MSSSSIGESACTSIENDDNNDNHETSNESQSSAHAQRDTFREIDLQLQSSSKLQVLIDPAKGRGIYASSAIPPNTLVAVSPILLVPASEYRDHSLNKTIFESYLFTWSKATGDMALALGLGSLFNHSPDHPNVSFTLDKENMTIRYTTKREIKEGEELCIYYGHGVVFGGKGELLVQREPGTPENEEDVFKVAGLLGEEEQEASKQSTSTLDIDEQALIPLESLPLEHVTKILSPEDIPLETMDIYALRIHPRDLGPVFAFLKDTGFDVLPSLKHIRRVKRSPSTPEEALVSLCPISHISLSDLTLQIQASPRLVEKGCASVTPEITQIPANPARTDKQKKEWTQTVWPVSLVPIKEDVLAKEMKASWTSGKLEWMRRMCEMAVSASVKAEEDGEHPIACLVSESWDGAHHSLSSEEKMPIILSSARDIRLSSCNPLQHAVLNLLSRVASLDLTFTRPCIPNSAPYLLTDLTIFMTHEPCLLCSMALLHSRIRCLVYVRGSKGAGGCGSVYDLHEQKGTNHRFEVWKVKEDGEWEKLREKVKVVELDP